MAGFLGSLKGAGRMAGRIIESTRLGKSATNIVNRVGVAMRTNVSGQFTSSGKLVFSYGSPRVGALRGEELSTEILKRELRDFARPFAPVAMMARPAVSMGKWTAIGVGKFGWKMGKSMYKHPGMWWVGAGVAGATVGTLGGIRQGLKDQGYPIETRDLSPPIGGGPGYQTWVKGAGRPMSPNHLGAAGLPLALHKTRHGV